MNLQEKTCYATAVFRAAFLATLLFIFLELFDPSSKTLILGELAFMLLFTHLSGCAACWNGLISGFQ
jgi:hypothetical protein